MNFNRFVLLQVVLNILLFICVFFTSEQETKESIIGFYSIVSFVVYLYTIKAIGAEYISLYSFFIIFMYLFNLGLPISRFIGYIGIEEENFMNRKIYSMGKDNFISYLLYAYTLVSFIEIGGIKYLLKNPPMRYRSIKSSVNNNSQGYYKKIGLLCIAIGIIPFYILEKSTITFAMIYGYQSEDVVDTFSGTGIGLLANFVYIGFFTILLYYRGNRKRNTLLTVLFVFYQVIRMYLTGDRSTGIMYILITLLVYHTYVSRIEGKKLLLGIGVSYLAMAFLKMIESTRVNQVHSESELFQNILANNPFFETIFEFGGNVWSGLMVFYSMSDTYYRLGSTYIASIIGKPLSILNVTNSVWESADFSNFIIKSRDTVISSVSSAMGGSFSGEVFFNFGYFGILLMPIFGYYLAKFSNACTLERKNIVFSSYLLYIATLVIWWVRQYFPNIAWHSLFYGITLYILCSVFTKKR